MQLDKNELRLIQSTLSQRIAILRRFDSAKNRSMIGLLDRLRSKIITEQSEMRRKK